jgi:hypothetical protein
MNEYTDKCTNCGITFTYWGDKPNDPTHTPCSADCEQAIFDKGDDETLWSESRKALHPKVVKFFGIDRIQKLNIGYNKSRLMLAREYIASINEAALKLEDLFSDWHPDINTSLSDLGLEDSVSQLTLTTQTWMDSIDATFTEESE